MPQKPLQRSPLIVCLIATVFAVSCMKRTKIEEPIEQEAAVEKAPQHQIEHSNPAVAQCVAEAYARSGTVTPVMGLVSVDNTGTTPRYAADPALPGLVSCLDTGRVPLPSGASTFLAERAPAGGTKVSSVPEIVSGEAWEETDWFGTQFSVCLLKQPGLRTPQEGAVLARVSLDAAGLVTEVKTLAVTVQWENDRDACLRTEFADVRIPEPVKGPVTVNLRKHIRVGEADD